MFNLSKIKQNTIRKQLLQLLIAQGLIATQKKLIAQNRGLDPLISRLTANWISLRFHLTVSHSLIRVRTPRASKIHLQVRNSKIWRLRKRIKSSILMIDALLCTRAPHLARSSETASTKDTLRRSNTGKSAFLRSCNLAKVQCMRISIA